MIFNLAAQGYSILSICKELRERKIITPSVYSHINGLKKYNNKTKITSKLIGFLAFLVTKWFDCFAFSIFMRTFALQTLNTQHPLLITHAIALFPHYRSHADIPCGVSHHLVGAYRHG